MEKKRILVKVKKPEVLKEKTRKQIRFEARAEERKKNRGPTKPELLALEGRRYVHFVSNIDEFSRWVNLCKAAGKKPNDRFNEMIAEDLAGGD
jgi:hypothetical protein